MASRPDAARTRRPVVMIHGAFCGGWVFDRFRQPFEAAGHQVLTPDLPGHGDGRSPAGLSMADYAQSVAALCEAQTQSPVLVGHSMGGLVAQLAAARLTRNRPLAGLILLAPSPPWGVMASSMEEAVSAVGLYGLGPYWLQAVEPQYALARTYSLDRLPRDAVRPTFERMTAESGRALFETLNWWLDPLMTTSVGPVEAPILSVAGECDLIHPPSTVRRTAARLGGTFRAFPQMSHWLPAEPGWEAVAAACLDWMSEHARTAA